MVEEKKIETGVHKTKVTGWGIRETNNGGAQIWVRFANNVIWFQNVNSNNIGDEIAARGLILCGFKGNDLPDLFDDDCFDLNRDVEIYVQYKVNHEGNNQMQVNIHDPSRNQIKGNLDKREGLKFIKSIKATLKMDFKKAKGDISDNGKGVADEPKAKTEDDFDDTEIPF